MKMTDIAVLNVKDGLSVRVSTGAEAMVYDCGTHVKSGWGSSKPPAYCALIDDLLIQPHCLSTIAISHIHSDHFNGFLAGSPPGLSRDPRILLPRLPKVDYPKQPGVINAFLSCLMAADLASYSLSSTPGLYEIDLVRRIQKYAPGAVPVPLSQGDPVPSAGGLEWHCLWPPRCFRLGDRAVGSLAKAIQAFNELAGQKGWSWLNEVLERVRESKTYTSLVDDNAQDNRENSFVEFEIESDELDDDENVLSDDSDLADAQPLPLERVNRQLRNAANILSLVLRSDSGEIILFGDATKSVVTRSLDYWRQIVCKEPKMKDRVAVAVNPHHGGKNHRPKNFLLAADFWVSSCGPWLDKQVDTWYSSGRKRHHITNGDGKFEAHVRGRDIVSTATFFPGWCPYCWRSFTFGSCRCHRCHHCWL